MRIFDSGCNNFLKIMASTRWLWAISLLLTLFTSALGSQPRVVCYYTNWSVYRPGTARFNPQNINPYLCTHLVYAFGGFTKENSLKPFDKYQDIEKGGYAKFTGLKTYNKNLKTLLAIGGWNEGSTRFSPMVASRERRKEFVKNVIKFLRQNRFDGLDLDWEYPAFRDGGKPKDRENYAKLVKELREEFDREAEKTGRPRLLLTMAVPAGIEYIEKGFDIKTLNRYLDWMNLLTYDYHSAFEPAVNHHAPLYPLEEPNEYSVDSELNIDHTIKFYIEKGADPGKLVLGIPTYGRSYTLFNPEATEIGAPADGPGEQGDATREKGYLAYYEICEALKPKKKKRNIADDDDSEEKDEDASEEEQDDEPWTVMYPNPDAMGPVAYKGNQWVGYDDIDIVKKKAEYVAESGLGGIMFWSIDNDDFRGNCHGKPYPLIEAAKEAYVAKLGSTDNAIIERTRATPTPVTRRNRPRTTTTVKPATAAKLQSNKRKSAVSTTPAWNVETPEPPTTPDPGADFKCTDEGFFPHPRDCKKYFWCLDSGPSNLGIVAHQFTCPSGLFFNKAADSCDFARNVLCKKTSSTTKAPTTKKSTTTSTTTTTTRRPIKLTSKSALQFRTTTTTTEAPESVEEAIFGQGHAEIDGIDVDAEDPRVIKELIELIKKVGGVEQLEKHLRFAESSSANTGNSATTTPSSFNKKLYQKVLERTRGKNKFGANVNADSTQNSRSGPQNAGLESAQEIISARKERPQYTTINRSRPNSVTADDTEDTNEESSLDVPRKQSRSKVAEEEVKVATTIRPLQYVNIRRARPTTLSTSDTADDTASRYSLFERSEPVVSVSDTSNIDIINTKRESSLEYVTIRRQRPTTEETTTTTPYQNTEQQESLETIEREKSPLSTQPQYTSVVRSRSTTLTPVEEIFASPEPTTVLSVQISSLLNSPTPENTERISVESDKLLTTTDVSEASPTTTTVTTTTTTSTEPPVRSTSAPRRTVFRRRGSTTTPAPTSSTVSQVSSERAHTNVRRRRPLFRPNEISSDVPNESDETEISRRIRSTTPDSREIEGDNKNDNIGTRNRYRIRSQQTFVDDSVAAAASSAPRGQFRPKINRDELISLTPIDKETPAVAPNASSFKPARRYRGRPSTTAADKLEDSEVSAATIETRTPSILPRSRSRFRVSPTIRNVKDSSTLGTESNPNLPTFGKFTPRPFTSRTKEEPLEETQNGEEEEDKLDNEDISTRVPVRLPFGRVRPTEKLPSSGNGIQARKLPFPLNRLSTTPNSITEENNDEAEEEKADDIFLSESAIEEKEHEEIVPVENQKLAKEETDIKRISPTLQQSTVLLDSDVEQPPSASNSTNVDLAQNRQRKFKIIRRRPATTTTTSTIVSNSIFTSATDSHDVSSVTPVLPRIRKVIRKKIKPLEVEQGNEIKPVSAPETLALSTTENVVNYGEKSLTTTTTPVTIITTSELSIKIKDNEDKTVISTEDKNVTTENGDNEKVITYDENGDGKAEDPNKDELATDSDKKPEDSDREIPTLSRPSLFEKSIDIDSDDDYESKQETTTKSTTRLVPTSRSRLPYRPPKRLFTSTTESSSPSSSKTYSRKYNIGAYTSPATLDKPSDSIRSTIRRPLFTSKPFTRKTSTTLSTTKNVEEQEYYSDEEEIIDEEPESPLILVPPNKLYTRKPNKVFGNVESDEVSSQFSEEDEAEEEISHKPLTTRKPFFRPKVVNSNTFRTSTTTELPKRQSVSEQNRTAAVYSRFGNRGNVTETKKRVQNVPVGYTTPKSNTKLTTITTPPEATQNNSNETSTMFLSTEIETTTEDEDYLTMLEVTDALLFENSTTLEETTLSKIDVESTTLQMETDIDDYLEYADNTTTYPSTMNLNTETQSIDFTIDSLTTRSPVTTEETTLTMNTTEIAQPETTTTIPHVSPIIKTQFDKLFSVSRVVEVSSKLDKHRLNKYNESKLIESGNVVQVKKPTEDKIGEVNRFSLIKIFEDEIPIYLTKLRHVYPVENPPYNPIRIDEARNARALTNFADVGKENLIASESINEAYRHLSHLSPKSTDGTKNKEHVERFDDFLMHVNENGKSEEIINFRSFPQQWQFIPAAYENERNKNMEAKSFEMITPRHQLTEPSTLPLEGLFKTESPMSKARKASDENHQPFVVYSAVSENDKNVNLVKLHLLKPEEGRSIKTYARGQEFEGGSSGEETTAKNLINISVLPSVNTAQTFTMTPEVLTTTELSSPLNEDSTTYSPVFITDAESMSTAVNTATTTETLVPESTTLRAVKISNDALSENAKKRPKFTFPRRLTLTKATNITRNNPTSISIKNSNKINKSLPLKINQNVNKTTGFNPTKSRFSANRSQNVPVDINSKKSASKLGSRFNLTESQKIVSTTERKPNFKPVRPNLLRPAFVPRKSIQSAIQVTSRDRRRNFIRRTRPTPSSSASVTVNPMQPETTKTTEATKITRRNKFAPRRKIERPDPTDGSAATEAAKTVNVPRSTSKPVRRPFRVASRRRTSSTSSTPEPTTPVSEEFLQDAGENDSAENPALNPRVIPTTNKPTKIQRRPLTSLKERTDQNPSATNEEENKRHSKKFSASFKQNQLEAVLRKKTNSQEEVDATATENNSRVSDFSDDISAETAVVIAAHQLLAAPLPSTINYDEENTKKTTKTYSTIRDDIRDREVVNAQPKSKKKSTSTPISIIEFPSTQTYKKSEYTTSYETPQYTQTRIVPDYTDPGIQTNPVGYSGVSSPRLGPSTARYLGTSDKFLSIPIDEFGYSTDAYTGGLGQEPSYFTREYLLASPVTRSYDDEYQYLSPPTTPTTTRKSPKKPFQRKISTTLRPSTQPYVVTTTTTVKPRRVATKKTIQTTKQPNRTYRPIENYDYYDDADDKVVSKYLEGTKVVVHGTGTIECLDIGNFPHPTSCKKFISCARMESGGIVGWEYICPKGLSFDPVGGICNWSAGLGCDEN